VDETCCDWAQYKKIAGLFENITNPNYLKKDGLWIPRKLPKKFLLYNG
jgi:hypothetical protein